MMLQLFPEMGLLLLALLMTTPLFGGYMALVFEGREFFCKRWLGRFEKLIYRAIGINPEIGMDWKGYLKALLCFNFFGFLSLLFLQFFQQWLPLNPEKFTAVSWHLAINTAMSFVTNTDWQSYSGESSLSYTVQMLGLTVQNFCSAGTGLCALLALLRGIRSKGDPLLGNFWVDMTRSILYILLPLSILFGIFLMSEGVIQNFDPYQPVTTLEGRSQLLPMGPVASQVAIKQLGTNGGGFFGANGAHPFENPTPLSNFVQTFAILMLPAALTYTYGVMLSTKKQGWLFFWVMFILWAIWTVFACYIEIGNNPAIGPDAFWEGKEVRLAPINSALWAIATTATGNGSVNSALSSLKPFSGAAALFNILSGESIFGGIGVGLCSVLMFAFLTVFICGLMVGKTPEFASKKLSQREVIWVVLTLMGPAFLSLAGAAFTSALPQGISSVGNAGPHGVSELLYAFASTSNNNGSSFGSLNVNSTFYDLSLALCMFLGRLSIIVPSLAIAGNFATKKQFIQSLGNFKSDNWLFALLLGSVIIIVGALTFFPALALGPIAEQFLMLKGRTF